MDAPDSDHVDEVCALIRRTQPGLGATVHEELPQVVRLALFFAERQASWSADASYDFLLWFMPRNAIVVSAHLGSAFEAFLAYLRALPRLDRWISLPEMRRLVAGAEELRDRFPLAMAVEGRWNASKRLLGAKALEEIPPTIATAESRIQRAMARHNASSPQERARRLGPSIMPVGEFLSHEYPAAVPLGASELERAVEAAPASCALAILLEYFSTSRTLTPTGLLRLVDVRAIATAMQDASLLRSLAFHEPVASLRSLPEPARVLLDAAELHAYIRRDGGVIATTPRGAYALKDPGHDFEQLLQLLLSVAAGNFPDDDFGTWSWQALLLDLLEADAPMPVCDVLAVSGLRWRVSFDDSSARLLDLEMQHAWRAMLQALGEVGLVRVEPLDALVGGLRQEPAQQLLYRADTLVALTPYGRAWAHAFGSRVGVIRR